MNRQSRSRDGEQSTHRARCSGCSMLVAASTQARLDEFIDALGDPANCEHDDGHQFEQTAP